jgi:hypothetical protein
MFTITNHRGTETQRLDRSRRVEAFELELENLCASASPRFVSVTGVPF